MYCMCQNPKRVKNSANGVTFEVCAKSKGGCGKEYGGVWTSNKPCSEIPLTIESVEGACLRALAAHVGLDPGGQDYSVVGQINPHRTTEECPACHGAGWFAKLYPSGHTEESCDYCDGIGQVEI